MDEELTIPDTRECYVCGAKIKRDGYSLHCWDIEYECGCKIYGALGDKGIYLDKPCPNKGE